VQGDINVLAAINLYEAQYKFIFFEAYWFLDTPSGLTIDARSNVRVFYVCVPYNSYTTEKLFSIQHSGFRSLNARNMGSHEVKNKVIPLQVRCGQEGG